jgi:hypothetical protein
MTTCKLATAARLGKTTLERTPSHSPRSGGVRFTHTKNSRTQTQHKTHTYVHSNIQRRHSGGRQTGTER